MLSRAITVSGTTSQHTLVVPTVYKYVTVFNHSRHRLSFYPDNVIDQRALLYRVPSQIYATLPLIGSGQVASCLREVTYTAVSEGESVAPTVIQLVFSEDLEAINIPFPDQQEQPQFPDRNLNPLFVDIFNVSMPLANTEYSLVLPARTKKMDVSVIGGDSSINFRVAFQTGRVATPTAPFLQLFGNQVYFSHRVFLPSPTTIYFACSTAGRVMQIETWRD